MAPIERHIIRMAPLHTISIAGGILICLSSLLFSAVKCKDNLRTVYEWREIDFKYSSSEERWAAIEQHEFKPNHVIPFGLEVYQTRLFLTLPRWKDGVPCSLAYINLNDNTTKTPALIPYPSWEAHSLNESDPELVSPFRVKADRCGKLWVLDARISGILSGTKLFGPAQLLIYDLHNDDLLRRYVFPHDQVKEGSFLANLAIEDEDCENTYAYAADLGSPGLVVYSWQQQESWRVQHNFFYPDPLAGNFSIDQIEFQWDDGLYGLALSKAQTNGFGTLYFHPLSSTMEFAVSTGILRNKTLATSGQIYSEFKVLGSRGSNGQAGASFLDQATGVMFYAMPNLNAVACWQSSTGEYTNELQGRVFTSPSELLFPSDVKVDKQSNLWVLSNRLHEFIYEELLPTTVNFRILRAFVKDAIKNTPCDIRIKTIPEIITNFSETIRNATAPKALPPTSSGSLLSTSGFILFCASFFLLLRS